MQSGTRPVDDEHVYRALLANTQDAVFIVGLDFRVIRANPRAALMFGYPLDDLMGLSVAQLITASELPTQRLILEQVLAGEVLPLFERPLRRLDGSIFQGEINLSLVQGSDALPMYFLAIVRDVTERDARLQELSESQRLFGGIAAMLPGIIHILDIVDNRTIYVNRELIQLLGYPTNVPAGVVDRLQTTLIHPDDQKQVAQDYARFRDAADHEVIEGEYRVRTADGQWRWLYSRSSIFKRDENGVPRQIVSVLIDIDDRKRETERRLAEQERIKLVNDIASATATEMPDDRFIGHVVTIVHQRFPGLRVALATVSSDGLLCVQRSAQPPAMAALDGECVPLIELPDYEAALVKFEPLVIEDSTLITRQRSLSAALGERDARALLVVPLRHGDALLGLLSLHSAEAQVWEPQAIETLREGAAYVSAAIFSAEQRRVRQKTEAALRESERLYRTLIDHFPNGSVVLFDHSLRYVIAGGTALVSMGLTPERLEGHTIGEVFPLEVTALLEPYYRRALAGERVSFDTDWFGRFYTTHVLPVIDDQGAIIAGLSVITDITERKQLEERSLELAVERERIRFLSDFVRNVSHDLRTPLSVLNTSLYLMRKVSDPARQAERIDSMKEQVDRLTRLIEQLMTMSRLDNPEDIEYLPVDLCELARLTARSFEKMAQERSLALDLRIDIETLDVLADDTQLTIALSSLLENELQYASTRVGLHVFKAAGGAVVELSDDGPGIPANEIARIFDRFYRADKARSTETGGTGLGLSIANKIIDNHGGRIEVETQLGLGSVFRVTLPLAPVTEP